MAAGKRDRKRRHRKERRRSAEPNGGTQLGWAPFFSAAALWASFAPVGLGLLAWVAPIGWLHVAERNDAITRRGYIGLWLSGCLFWLLVLQGIRLAYWPLYLGWVALSLYLALYTPLFVGATRVLRHWKMPLMLAAPVAWVGLEMIRSCILTGFSANLLVHTQAHYPIIIQIADQIGGFGVSFVMMATSVAVYQCAISAASRRLSQAVLPMAVAIVLILLLIGYGVWRLREADRTVGLREPLFTALLVQENTPTMFDANLESLQRAWTSYLETTRAQSLEHGVAHLVVWPESTFSAGSPWIDSRLPAELPEELTREDLDRSFVREQLSESQTEFDFKVGLVLAAASQRALGDTAPADTGASTEQPEEPGTPFALLGADAWEIRADRIWRFNSALWIGPDGKLVDHYDKVHLVMFGEYIPLGPLLQWLRDLFDMQGAQAGDGPKCFQLRGAWVSPSICFESTMPSLISGQVRKLTVEGRSPDVLINLTNDSWFRGSSILDHHLASSILCAVENRRPMLVAANSGLSAEIDSSGRVLQVTERFAIDGIWAQPRADARWGLVQSFGYPIGWICAAVVLLTLGANRLTASQRRRSSHSPPPTACR